MYPKDLKGWLTLILATAAGAGSGWLHAGGPDITVMGIHGVIATLIGWAAIVQTPAHAADRIATLEGATPRPKSPPPLSLLSLHCLCMLVAAVALSGCVSSAQQPGQTPAQQRACSQNATAHNVLVGSSLVLGTATATESAIGSQVAPAPAKTLAITALITGALAAISTGVGQYFVSAYNAGGCSPALLSRPAPPVAAPDPAR